MKIDTTNLRVRYGETDQMGIVYYGNYARYFEVGRTEWLRKLGFSYSWMEDKGILLPVINLQVNFLKSAYYDQMLEVKTILKSLPSYKIEFDYEILNEERQLVTTGNTSLMFLNKKSLKPMRAPEYLLEKLRNIEV